MPRSGGGRSPAEATTRFCEGGKAFPTGFRPSPEHEGADRHVRKNRMRLPSPHCAHRLNRQRDPLRKGVFRSLPPLPSWSAALIAAVIGFGGTVALVVQAIRTLGGDVTQTASAVTSLCLGIAT